MTTTIHRTTSLYLDAVRFLAAIVVFVGHVGSGPLGAGMGWQLTPYGAAAVVIFFVLSGFVIGLVSHRQEKTYQSFVAARAARLYSVAVPALVLTAFLDRSGAAIRPDLYEHWSQLLGEGVWRIPVSLLFLNESWGWGVLPGSNGAYWSLGFEAFYYALFGFAFYARGVMRIAGFSACALAGGPQILALFPIWLMGLAGYYVTVNWKVGPQKGWVFLIGSAIAGLALLVWGRYYGMPVSFKPLFEHDWSETVQDYLLAALFVVHLVGLNAVGETFSGIARKIRAPVRWFAGATFTIYLMHVPLVMFVRAAFEGRSNYMTYNIAILVLPLAAAFSIAELTERRKAVWRRMVDWAMFRMRLTEGNTLKYPL